MYTYVFYSLKVQYYTLCTISSEYTQSRTLICYYLWNITNCSNNTHSSSWYGSYILHTIHLIKLLHQFKLFPDNIFILLLFLTYTLRTYIISTLDESRQGTIWILNETKYSVLYKLYNFHKIFVIINLSHISLKEFGPTLEND